MNFHKFILIGLLFQFLDINIGIDLVPDFIGFIIIAYAFSKIAIPYAALGMYCSVLLSISSFIEMFLEKTQTFSLYEAVDLWVEILFIVVGLVNILYFACIFYVSNKIVKTENHIFSKVFIGAQILMQLFYSLGMHLPFNEFGYSLIPAAIVFMVLVIYFVVFLWKRKNIEKKMYEEMQVQ